MVDVGCPQFLRPQAFGRPEKGCFPKGWAKVHKTSFIFFVKSVNTPQLMTWRGWGSLFEKAVSAARNLALESWLTLPAIVMGVNREIVSEVCQPRASVRSCMKKSTTMWCQTGIISLSAGFVITASSASLFIVRNLLQRLRSSFVNMFVICSASGVWILVIWLSSRSVCSKVQILDNVAYSGLLIGTGPQAWLNLQVSAGDRWAAGSDQEGCIKTGLSIRTVWDFIISVGIYLLIIPKPVCRLWVHKYRSASPVDSQLNAQTLNNYPAANIMQKIPPAVSIPTPTHTIKIKLFHKNSIPKGLNHRWLIWLIRSCVISPKYFLGFGVLFGSSIGRM